MRRLITVTGPDRPGLIAAISRVLADAGADLEDISMTRLSGNFAMILVARHGDEAPIREGLDDASRRLGLFIHVEPSVETPEEQEANGFVSAVGPNRIGIVAAVSKVLADHGANILEMNTRLLEKTEVPVYFVRIEALIPKEWDALARELCAVGAQLGIEVRLEPLEQSEL